MRAIQIISQDVFDKIRSRFQNLEMGDETGAVTIDPAEARFFDFDFVVEGNDFGRVSLSLNDPGSLKIYYSQGITENIDDDAKQLWYNFLKEMRLFAMRRLLRFDTRDVAKSNLDKNDFQQMAANQGPKEEEMTTTMNESKWTAKSSKKTSRAVKGTTEVIVRHRTPVDEMYPGARSQRKNIKAIFIQNKEGERFKYPFIHTAGAFAMAQHVDHGGVPHDPAGKAIIRMSEEISQLQQLQRTVHGATLHDDATGIIERAVGRLNELKNTINALGKRHHYETWITEFNEQEYMDDGLELDEVTMEEYKQKFTQTNFKEELAGYFPLLHRIMSEANKVNLEQYVQNEAPAAEGLKGAALGGAAGLAVLKSPSGIGMGAKIGSDIEDAITGEDDDDKKENFSKFEEWAEALEQGTLTPDQIEALKKALAEKEETDNKLDYETAYNFFNEFGIESDSLETAFEKASENTPDGDPMDTFKTWAKLEKPGLLAQLGIQDAADIASDEEPQSTDLPPETDSSEVEPAKENDEMSWTNNTMSAESKNAAMKEMILRKVKSFYNESNPELGPFRAPDNVALEAKKDVEEKFGEAAGEQAYETAKGLIELLTRKWEDKHGPIEKDGLNIHRLKELVGNLKHKVEEIGAETTNIMPAEEFDPKQIDPKQAAIPAYTRNPKFASQQAAQAAMAQRNKEVGADVFKSARNESVEIGTLLKLAGLDK